MSKILFISDNDHSRWGGSEVSWPQTAIYLAQNTEHEIIIFAKYWENEPIHYENLRQAGCRVEYRKERFQKPSLSEKLLKRILPHRLHQKYIASKIDLWELFLQREHPSLIILSIGDHNSGYKWTEIARKHKLNYVLIVHLVKEGIIPNDDAILDRINSHYMNARQIYFVSRQSRKLLQIQCTDKLDNSSIMFNPIPKLTREIEWPDCQQTYKIACVANLLVIHKGQDVLLQVLSMSKWKKRNITLNIYGMGKHEKFLKRLANFLSLDQVNFYGFVSDKVQIWETNHALILPSRMEGMSLALLEAMNYARVPITTDVGGASEIIDDDINGFIGSGCTVKLLDELLERAWTRRLDWEEMGKLAAKKIKKTINKDPIKEFAGNILNLINE